MKNTPGNGKLSAPAYFSVENDNYNTAIKRLNASIPSGVHL